MFEALRGWMLRNARPLDLARYRYHFEDAGMAPVLVALAAYQNEDGGFGSALEPDNWNPESNPLTTWFATAMLEEIGLEDGDHPVVQGILRYLDSGQDFRDGRWADTVPSTNEHPHAPWWSYDGNAQVRYNPTAALAGFIIRYAQQGSGLLRSAEDIAWQAVEAFYANETQDMHELRCYIQLADACEAAGRGDLFEIDALRQAIAGWLDRVVTQDRAKWETNYACMPSMFLHSRTSPYYPALRDAAEDEASFLLRTQRPDGTWLILWSWNAYPEAWAISKHWWTAHLVIENLCYLKGFDAL